MNRGRSGTVPAPKSITMNVSRPIVQSSHVSFASETKPFPLIGSAILTPHFEESDLWTNDKPAILFPYPIGAPLVQRPALAADVKLTRYLAGDNWLQTQMSLWTRFRLRKISFQWIPQCPTTTSGAIAYGFIKDVNDALRLDVDNATNTLNPLYNSSGTPMTAAELQVMSGGSFPVWEPRTFHMSIPEWAKERISVYSQSPYLGVAASVGNSRTALFPGNKELFPAGVLGVIPFGMTTAVPNTTLDKFGRWQVHYHIDMYEKIPSAFNIEGPGNPVSASVPPSIEELVSQFESLRSRSDKVPEILRTLDNLRKRLNRSVGPIPQGREIPEYTVPGNSTQHDEFKRDVDIVPLEGGTLVATLNQDSNSRPRRSAPDPVEGCCQIGHDGDKAYIKCDVGSSLCPFRFPSLEYGKVEVVVDLERVKRSSLLCIVTSDRKFRSESRGLVKTLPQRFETENETKEVYSLSSDPDSRCTLSFYLDSSEDYYQEFTPFNVFVKWSEEI